jgi:hypothetical protein
VGSIIPLPGIPSKVIKGGGWTLQRLVLETSPPIFATDGAVAASAAPERAVVILKTKIDSLDVTVLKGGAVAVGTWATQHGFFLPPDAPEVLDFYAQRSPIFMAVRFNAKRAAAQGVLQGEGTPVDIVIPTPNPWVPLRILTLGLKPTQLVQADVYLLTDRTPALLPVPNGDNGLNLDHSAPGAPATRSQHSHDSEKAGAAAWPSAARMPGYRRPPGPR